MMINDAISPTPAWTAARRHAAAVITEIAANAATRTHSPSSTPDAPADYESPQHGIDPLQHSLQETARARVATWEMPNFHSSALQEVKRATCASN